MSPERHSPVRTASGRDGQRSSRRLEGAWQRQLRHGVAIVGSLGVGRSVDGGDLLSAVGKRAWRSGKNTNTNHVKSM